MIPWSTWLCHFPTTYPDVLDWSSDLSSAICRRAVQSLAFVTIFPHPNYDPEPKLFSMPTTQYSNHRVILTLQPLFSVPLIVLQRFVCTDCIVRQTVVEYSQQIVYEFIGQSWKNRKSTTFRTSFDLWPLRMNRCSNTHSGKRLWYIPHDMWHSDRNVLSFRVL